jgi:hypothetical protein
MLRDESGPTPSAERVGARWARTSASRKALAIATSAVEKVLSLLEKDANNREIAREMRRDGVHLDGVHVQKITDLLMDGYDPEIVSNEMRYILGGAKQASWLKLVHNAVAETILDALNIRSSDEAQDLMDNVLDGREFKEMVDDLLEYANDPVGARYAARWETMPKGWTDESRKKFWNTMTGDVKHKVTKCIKEMEGKVDDPGAFCASLADRVDPGWRSRQAGRGRDDARPPKGTLYMDGTAFKRNLTFERAASVVRSTAPQMDRSTEFVFRLQQAHLAGGDEWVWRKGEWIDRPMRYAACCENCTSPSEPHTPCAGGGPLTSQPDYGTSGAALPRAATSTLSPRAAPLAKGPNHALWKDQGKWVITDLRRRVFLEPFGRQDDAYKAWAQLAGHRRASGSRTPRADLLVARFMETRSK